jgi:pimeloyl-ACP methyl ester carboxylesterase
MIKRDVLLLLGALGNEKTMFPLGKVLENGFEVHYLQFSGHGLESVADEAFTIETFAWQILNFIQEKNLVRPIVMGYSMGGYAALLAAAADPEAIGAVLTLATKLKWTEEFAERECNKLKYSFLQEKAPAFMELLGSRFGHARVEEVLRQTSNLLKHLGESKPLNDSVYQRIECPVYLCVGDLDKMVSREETEEVSGVLKKGEFISISETPHQIEAMNPQIVAHTILTYIS